VKAEELYNGHPFIEEACYQEMPNIKWRLVICCLLFWKSTQKIKIPCWLGSSPKILSGQSLHTKFNVTKLH